MKLNQTLLVKLFYVGSFFLIPAVVLAEDADDMARCFAISDTDARVACYDDLARPQQDISDSSSETPAEKLIEPVISSKSTEPEVAANDSTTPEQAELEESRRAELFGQEALIDIKDESKEVLLSKVVAINATVPTKLQITLANGQVWNQTIGKIFRLKEGDAVRIYRSGWGKSYRLGKEDKPGFIQVIRKR